MTTKLYFVRHAQSDHTVTDAKTRPLTEKGLDDAKLLPGFFADVPVSRIFSSPYIRAVQTVLPLAHERKLSVIKDDRMREWMGGRPFKNELFESRMQEMFENEQSTNGGAESLKALKRRTQEFILHLLTRCPGETIVIATHALAMTAALKNYDDAVGYEFLMNLLPVTPFVALMTFDDFSLSSMRFINPFPRKNTPSQEETHETRL